jgi:predicted acetyltransferase
LVSNRELYSHDLSDTFGWNWDTTVSVIRTCRCIGQASVDFHLIRMAPGCRVAFATQGLPASLDMDAFDVAEFFVLRRYRRSGVGRRAAFLLWNRFASRWIVRASEANAIGHRFWARTIAEYSNGVFTETTRAGTPHTWRVFSFDSRNRRASSEAS